MKVTIFSRILLGYLFIFGLVVLLSGYVVYRIGRFNQVTESVWLTNNRIIDVSEKLSDAILSQVRNERKFLISKDGTFYNQFLRFKNDFERYLGDLTLLSRNAQTKDTVTAIRASYHRYQSLVRDEFGYLESAASYPQKWYREEKEKLSNSILEGLETLRSVIQQDTNEKIKELYQAGVKAQRMAVGMTVGLLVLGITLSYIMNRSITRPIWVLVKKTREISKGDFKEDLQISSPPELAELGKAINLMCQKLGEIDRMKSDFFSTVTHELRTPLSSIKMGLSVLAEGREGPLTDGQKELLELVRAENNRMIELVNAILDLSKMEAGMMTYRVEQRDIVPLIEQVLKEMRPLVEAKEIRFESEIEERLPAANIDTERFLQALRNVIGNAVKFTPPRGRVNVSAQKVDNWLRISVADTGPGIPEDHLHSIFEKFKQVDGKGFQKTRGTGLGLAIAKQVVIHHGGRIWAESKPGQGSTFYIQLPV